MKITLLGAAGDVTGSAYLVQTKAASVLVDFGMFQGGPELEAKNVLPDQLRVSELDAVVLIYAHHPELFDEEAMELIREGELQQDMQSIHIAETAKQSMSINELDGPFMVIASSGMCTSGRIVHHLRHRLWQPETTVIIVGYQAHGSLGRQLVDGADRVWIFDKPVNVRAQIHTLGGFSAHAGQTELLSWYDHVAPSNPRVILTHGEAHGRNALAKQLAHRYGVKAQLPMLGDVVVVW